MSLLRSIISLLHASHHVTVSFSLYLYALVNCHPTYVLYLFVAIIF